MVIAILTNSFIIGRKFSGFWYSWVRSGNNNNYNNAYVVAAAGTYNNNNVTNTYGVRPALHSLTYIA